VKVFKPLWHEGTVIGAQLFQQQDRWFAFDQQRLADLIVADPWGLVDVEVDEEALAVDRLKLTRLKLRFPDGTLIDTTVSDVLPPARDLSRDVPAARPEVTVSVILPLLHADGQNCAIDDAPLMRPRRFFREFIEVQDINGATADEMAVERRALRLAFDFEDQADVVACPILRLKRATHGEFEIDPGFVPPCLLLTAHARHEQRIERLADILMAKAASLASRRRERNDGAAEFGVSDVSLFWMLHCVHSHWPDLSFLRSHPAQPPQRLYLALARLAGALITFSTRVTLADIPAYDHARQDEVFSTLEALIRDLLDSVIPSQVVVIDLKQKTKTTWSGAIHDPRLLEGADYYLSVRSALPGHQLIEQAPKLCKVGAPDEISLIINSALSGIPLRPVERAPAAIPARLEDHFFALDSSDPAYARMLAAQACEIYLPISVLGASVELYAVLKS
jgi:type VI secretion system protein ImpJ